MPRFHVDQLKILSTHLLASSTLTLPRDLRVVERLACPGITLLMSPILMGKWHHPIQSSDRARAPV